jgi:hypothetical protein
VVSELEPEPPHALATRAKAAIAAIVRRSDLMGFSSVVRLT